jgi:Zn-dependent metalloprotease
MYQRRDMNKVVLAAWTLAPVAFIGCGVTSESSTEFHADHAAANNDGTPYFVRGALGQVGTMIDTPASAQRALADMLPAIATALGAPSAELLAVRSERDELGMTHVRMVQQKDGRRVVGGDVIVQIDRGGTVRTINGTIRERGLPTAPSITAEEATRLATEATDEASGTGRSELTYLVSNRDGELYLAWEIEVTGALMNDLVYVDAITGNVVDRHPQVFTIKSRVIRNGNGGVFPVANAPIIGSEATPPTDVVALAAFTNTGLTYDCYKTLYNRDSYDNAGAVMNSQVHVVFPTPNGGTSPNNAVWYAPDATMAYGDGDGTTMKQLAYSLDVTAHELTHAVTTATANLIYQNESGALNEAMSDIMGAVCEAWNTKSVTANTWMVGEDIWTPNKAGDALRYMQSPTLDGRSPDYYPLRLTGPDDNGGVHSNSGIPNLAFYLLSAGGKHPTAKTAFTVPGIGIDKAGAIFQRALTTKFTANTNMAQARTLTEQAAQDLYPGTCAPTAVGLAWATVGVGGPAPTDAVPPTVAITSPAVGASVASGFQVQVSSTDDKCIHKVELLIDGAVAQTLTAAPYIFTTSATLASGAHTIEVKAYDAFNQASATSNVKINGGGSGTGSGGQSGDDDSEVTGGCATGTGGATGSWLLLCLALVLRPRRRR